MDKLFSGMAGKEAQPSSTAQGCSGTENKEKSPLPPLDRTHTNNKTVKKHFCATADTEKIDKIRAIAKTEGININAIVDLALTIVIDKYEELHGTVNIKKSKKGNIKNVFNL